MKLPTPCARCSGFTLIEVLVSVLILSIGMLGIAGLQAATSRYKMNSWVQNVSTRLVSDLSSRMRNNPTMAGPAFGETLGASSNYVLQDTWDEQQLGLLETPDDFKNCLEVGVECSASETATSDLRNWRLNVREMMPSGSAWIEGSRATGITVTLMWIDKNNVGGSDATLLVAPDCSSDTPAGAAQANCCPEGAEVPVGVRCRRLSFIP